MAFVISFIYDILCCIMAFLGWAYRGLTGRFLLLQNFSVAISVSPHVCFNFDFCVSKIMHL